MQPYTMQRQNETSSRSGYTLIEAVLVVVILSIVGLSSSYVIFNSMRVYARTAPALDVSYQAHLAVERLQRDIREMNGTASITAFTATDLAFDDTSGGTVAYAFSGGQLTRNGDLLADTVTAFAFTYRRADGTTTTTASELHLVEVDVTVQVKDQNARLRTSVFPRVLTP